MAEPKQRLVRNFLNTKKDNRALLWCLLTLFACLCMSHIYWNYELGEQLAASPDKVFKQGQYWRLFTSSFIHADMAHFLSNSLMLTVMGYFVSYNYGAIAYPILGFIAGILINFIVILGFKGESTLVGASGVVHYLWGFWLVLYIFIQRHIPLNRRLMKTTAVGIFVLAPTEFKPQVSYYAHGIGLFLGIVSGLVYFIFNHLKFRSFEVWEDVIEIVDEDLEYEALHSAPQSNLD